jgi:hypothetical protein
VALTGGCRQHAPNGRLDELLITNSRFNLDEDRGLVRIYGRVENTGDGFFRQVDVHALLRSAAQDNRGENTVPLDDIQPHEKRDFALTVTSAGRVKDVKLEIKGPETP